MSLLPFSYDSAVWACPLCELDSHFCLCEVPTVPPKASPQFAPPKSRLAELYELRADLMLACEGQINSYLNENVEASFRALKRVEGMIEREQGR